MFEWFGDMVYIFLMSATIYSVYRLRRAQEWYEAEVEVMKAIVEKYNCSQTENGEAHDRI